MDYNFECFNVVVYAVEDNNKNRYEIYTNFPNCSNDPNLEVGDFYPSSIKSIKKKIIGKKKVDIPTSILYVIGWE